MVTNTIFNGQITEIYTLRFLRGNKRIYSLTLMNSNVIQNTQPMFLIYH
jgi:hypothetical protein